VPDLFADKCGYSGAVDIVYLEDKIVCEGDH